MARLDPALGLASQSPVVPDGSNAMLEETMLDVASDPAETTLIETHKPSESTYTVFHLVYHTLKANTRMNETNGHFDGFASSAGLW